MADKTLIFGKDNWPHTIAAREAFLKEGDVEYINVVGHPERLSAMLKHSEGARKVPVIVEGNKVTIGFKGGT